MNSFESFKWLILSAGAAAGWGIQYAVVENMLKTSKPMSWMTYYFIGGAIACVIYGLLPGRTFPTLRASEWPQLLICVVIGVVSQWAILAAIQSRNATHASLIENAVPLFAIVASVVFYQEWHLTLRSGIGAALIFSGMFLVALDK